MRDHAVDGADFDAGTRAFGAVREYGTRRMRVSQDEKPAGGVCDGDFAGVVCALGGLSASGGRFHHDKRCVGSKRGMDAIVAHGVRSGSSSKSTALRTALQNGSNCGFSAGQRPRLKSFAASSRPPSTDLNHVLPWDW